MNKCMKWAKPVKTEEIDDKHILLHSFVCGEYF